MMMLQSMKPDLVLIDDDPLIHKAWDLDAKRLGKTLLCFYSLEDFLKSSCPKDVPIYVDCFVGKTKAVQQVNVILDRGYCKITLVSSLPSLVRKIYGSESLEISNKEFPDLDL
ncbi:MAG: hypothetical protein R3A11_05120 [Bdellovibrionota bacterium]